MPPAATTIVEHMHSGGYQTASFIANPNAGRLIGLERGVDYMWDNGPEHHSSSSVELHDEFWRFREAFPAEPYWVHFQTTDVHWPYRPVPPFAGLYLSPERRAELVEWDAYVFDELDSNEDFTVFDMCRRSLTRRGIDTRIFYDRHRSLYDETMAHQDAQLGRLVARLKATGEWERTLLIIGSDHGHPAGTYSRFGRGLLDPEPATGKARCSGLSTPTSR